MKPLFIIIGAVVAVLAVFLVYRVLKPGYRSAIGFKNRHASQIAMLSLTGFSKVAECRTLARGEHSFNYLGPQAIPDEVTITWRFVSNTTDRIARVSLASVPKRSLSTRMRQWVHEISVGAPPRSLGSWAG